MKYGLFGILAIMIALLLGYLVTTGTVALIFWLFKIGGITIDFNIWIAGLIFYILWLTFKHN